MGQKVNPIGMRVGLNKNWNSRWFASDKDYSTFLLEDDKIRKYLEKRLPKEAYLSHIEIERKKKENGYALRVFIYCARIGAILGREKENQGKNILALKKEISKLVSKNTEIRIDLVEVKNPNLDATIVANRICHQLEDRASFRIVQKNAIRDVRKAGGKGVKTSVSGRLGGADIARAEGYKDGTVSINTLRSDIDYACREAMTTYGKLGVKVWICRGEKEINPKKVAVSENKKGE